MRRGERGKISDQTMSKMGTKPKLRLLKHFMKGSKMRKNQHFILEKLGKKKNSKGNVNIEKSA